MLRGILHRLSRQDDGGRAETVDDGVRALPEQVSTILPADTDLIRAQGDKGSEEATRKHLEEKKARGEL